MLHSKMMQSQNEMRCNLTAYWLIFPRITLSAIILAKVLPFRQLKCVLDIQDSVSYSFIEDLKLMLKNQHFCIFIEGDDLRRVNILGKIKFRNFSSYFGVKFLSPFFSVMRLSDLRIKITVLVNRLFLS